MPEIHVTHEDLHIDIQQYDLRLRLSQDQYAQQFNQANCKKVFSANEIKNHRGLPIELVSRALAGIQLAHDAVQLKHPDKLSRVKFFDCFVFNTLDQSEHIIRSTLHPCDTGLFVAKIVPSSSADVRPEDIQFAVLCVNTSLKKLSVIRTGNMPCQNDCSCGWCDNLHLKTKTLCHALRFDPDTVDYWHSSSPNNRTASVTAVLCIVATMTFHAQALQIPKSRVSGIIETHDVAAAMYPEGLTISESCITEHVCFRHLTKTHARVRPRNNNEDPESRPNKQQLPESKDSAQTHSSFQREAETNSLDIEPAIEPTVEHWEQNPALAIEKFHRITGNVESDPHVAAEVIMAVIQNTRSTDEETANNINDFARAEMRDHLHYACGACGVRFHPRCESSEPVSITIPPQNTNLAAAYRECIAKYLRKHSMTVEDAKNDGLVVCETQGVDEPQVWPFYQKYTFTKEEHDGTQRKAVYLCPTCCTATSSGTSQKFAHFSIANGYFFPPQIQLTIAETMLLSPVIVFNCVVEFAATKTTATGASFTSHFIAFEKDDHRCDVTAEQLPRTNLHLVFSVVYHTDKWKKELLKTNVHTRIRPAKVLAVLQTMARQRREFSFFQDVTLERIEAAAEEFYRQVPCDKASDASTEFLNRMRSDTAMDDQRPSASLTTNPSSASRGHFLRTVADLALPENTRPDPNLGVTFLTRFVAEPLNEYVEGRKIINLAFWYLMTRPIPMPQGPPSEALVNFLLRQADNRFNTNTVFVLYMENMRQRHGVARAVRGAFRNGSHACKQFLKLVNSADCKQQLKYANEHPHSREAKKLHAQLRLLLVITSTLPHSVAARSYFRHYAECVTLMYGPPTVWHTTTPNVVYNDSAIHASLAMQSAKEESSKRVHDITRDPGTELLPNALEHNCPELNAHGSYEHRNALLQPIGTVCASHARMTANASFICGSSTNSAWSCSGLSHATESHKREPQLTFTRRELDATSQSISPCLRCGIFGPCRALISVTESQQRASGIHHHQLLFCGVPSGMIERIVRDVRLVKPFLDILSDQIIANAPDKREPSANDTHFTTDKMNAMARRLEPCLHTMSLRECSHKCIITCDNGRVVASFSQYHTHCPSCGKKSVVNKDGVFVCRFAFKQRAEPPSQSFIDSIKAYGLSPETHQFVALWHDATTGVMVNAYPAVDAAKRLFAAKQTRKPFANNSGSDPLILLVLRRREKMDEYVTPYSPIFAATSRGNSCSTPLASGFEDAIMLSNYVSGYMSKNSMQPTALLAYMNDAIDKEYQVPDPSLSLEERNIRLAGSQLQGFINAFHGSIQVTMEEALKANLGFPAEQFSRDTAHFDIYRMLRDFDPNFNVQTFSFARGKQPDSDDSSDSGSDDSTGETTHPIIRGHQFLDIGGRPDKCSAMIEQPSLKQRMEACAKLREKYRNSSPTSINRHSRNPVTNARARRHFTEGSGKPSAASTVTNAAAEGSTGTTNNVSIGPVGLTSDADGRVCIENMSCVYMTFPQLHATVSPYEFTACFHVTRTSKREMEEATSSNIGRPKNFSTISTCGQFKATLRSRMVIPVNTRKLPRHPPNLPEDASTQEKILFDKKCNAWARFAIAYFFEWESVNVELKDGKSVSTSQPKWSDRDNPYELLCDLYDEHWPSDNVNVWHEQERERYVTRGRLALTRTLAKMSGVNSLHRSMLSRFRRQNADPLDAKFNPVEHEAEDINRVEELRASCAKLLNDDFDAQTVKNTMRCADILSQLRPATDSHTIDRPVALATSDTTSIDREFRRKVEQTRKSLVQSTRSSTGGQRRSHNRRQRGAAFPDDPDTTVGAHFLATQSPSQQQAFTHIHSTLHELKQAAQGSLKILMLLGPPGTGKSFLLKQLQDMNRSIFGDSTCFTAASGAAAALLADNNLHASTYHHALGLNQNATKLNNVDAKATRSRNLESTLFVIDECSMISHQNLQLIIDVLEESKKRSRLLLLVGDFLQLEPVKSTILCDSPTKTKNGKIVKPTKKALQGWKVFEQLPFCVLDHTPGFSRFSDAKQSETMERILASPQNIEFEIKKYKLLGSSERENSEWAVARVLTKTNSARCRYNKVLAQNFATTHGTVVCRFLQHSTLLADWSIENRENKLPTTVGYFVKGAPGIINTNLCPELGVANGSECTLQHVFYNSEDARDAFHAAVSNASPGDIVDVPCPSGFVVAVKCNNTTFSVVLDKTMSSHEDVKCKGGVLKNIFQPIPADLAFSFTFYKAQGKSMEKVIIDLGSLFDDTFQPGRIGFSELYVGISRSRTFDGVRLLIPPDDLFHLHVTNTEQANRRRNKFAVSKV